MSLPYLIDIILPMSDSTYTSQINKDGKFQRLEIIPSKNNNKYHSLDEKDWGNLFIKDDSFLIVGNSLKNLNTLYPPQLRVSGRTDLYSLSVSTYYNDCIIGKNDIYNYKELCNMNPDQYGSLSVRCKGRYDSNKQYQQGLEVYYGARITALDRNCSQIQSIKNKKNINHNISYSMTNRITEFNNVSHKINLHSDTETILTQGIVPWNIDDSSKWHQTVPIKPSSFIKMDINKDPKEPRYIGKHEINITSEVIRLRASTELVMKPPIDPKLIAAQAAEDAAKKKLAEDQAKLLAAQAAGNAAAIKAAEDAIKKAQDALNQAQQQINTDKEKL